MLGAKSESGPQLLKGRGRGQGTVAETLLPQHFSKFLSPHPHPGHRPGGGCWQEVGVGKGGHGDCLGDGGSREVTTGLLKEHLLGLLLALLSQRSQK